MRGTVENLPALFTSNVHPEFSSLTETLKRIILPGTSVRGTKWRWTLSLIALSVLIMGFHILQLYTVDVYLNNLMSKLWLVFLAWDVTSVLLLAFVFFWQRKVTLTRPVDWMRYVWIFIMANQVVKMCLLYHPMQFDNSRYGLNRWTSSTSLTFSSYLSVLVLSGMLYWCSGSSVRYEHVQSWSMLSYILSVVDLMDALDLYGHHRNSFGRDEGSLSNAIRVFFVLGSLCSPFFALSVVSEANGTGYLQSRLTQMVELHLITSSWLFNFPVMIIRLCIFFTSPSAAISVFLSKNFVVWSLSIFQPAVAFGKEVR